MRTKSVKRVCPSCGEVAGAQPFCAACGVNLVTLERLPTREEWEATPTVRRSVRTAAPERPLWATGSRHSPSTGTSQFAPPLATEPVDEPLRCGQPRWRVEPMASWGYRAGAALADLGLAGLVALATIFIVAGVGGTAADAGGAGALAFLAAWLINVVVVAGLTNGQTLGKRFAGVRVIRQSGRKYGVGTALLRDVLCRLTYIVPLVWLVDALMPLGAGRQSLGDRIVSTRVMREPVYHRRRWPLAAVATVVTVGSIALAVASGAFDDTKSTYTGFDREVFVSGCKEDGTMSESACGCAFEYVAARLPYSDYQRVNSQDTDDWPPRVSRVVADAVNSCA